MKINKIFPFWIWPYSWGLSGQDRAIAKAKYSLEGYEQEVAILQIEHKDDHNKEYQRRYAEIRYRYNKISKDDYQLILIDLMEDDSQKKLARLEYNYKKNLITQTQYEKQLATLNGKPWVSVVNMSFGQNPSSPGEGSFDIDWNDQFIESLRANGYTGDDDAMVNLWFTEICKNIALEEYDGVGTFNEDSEGNLDNIRAAADGVNPVLRSYS